MGWLSKTFGGFGDFLEDYGLPIIGTAALGALTGGLGAASLDSSVLGGSIVGGGVGALSGTQMAVGNVQAEKAQQAQVAAAQKLADMQDPSRVVQQATAAPQIQQQQQVSEVNAATAQAKKKTLAKMNYNTGLQSFSKLGSFNSSTLG